MATSTVGSYIVHTNCPGAPSPDLVAAAEREMRAEDVAVRKLQDTSERRAIETETSRRSSLPPEHPDHICGMMCDGQDGASSYCARLRRKLFG